MTEKEFIPYVLGREGYPRQCIKATEEMGECIQRLARYSLSDRCDRDETAEEICDVILMMREMCCVFEISDEEVAERIQDKINKYMRRQKQ